MRKIISLLTIITLMCSMSFITVSATENVEGNLRSGTNTFWVSSANPSDTFYLSKNITAFETEFRVELERISSYNGDSIITLQFYNTGTKRYYTVGFEASITGVYYKTCGVDIPSGQYTVSIAYTPCHIYGLTCSF